ncbi:hypothetical protein AB0M47_35400 [Hamadaea sp. NPDC051192]|uniref:hypothetical protein n=1 Tax=Hamadaea sp. NPDC051192 TaxID=3154940 RepID=UPI00343D0DD5
MEFDRSSSIHLGKLRRGFSSPRIAPYDLLAANDALRSLDLYEWNTAVSAACYATLQGVEIALRNTVHDQLTGYHLRRGLPQPWVDDPLRLLDARRHADLRQARQRLQIQGYPAEPDRIVAALSFGFWNYLLSGRYEHTLWTPALRLGFPHLTPPRRHALAYPVSRLHRLRNRLAHHEPVHGRDLARDHEDMLFVLGSISPTMRAWAEGNSALPGVLGVRPAPVRIPLPRCP